MYKRYLLLGVVLVTVVLGFAAIGAAKSITLTFANQNPDTSWSGMHAIGPWAKQVEKATNGKVKVQIFYSQTLTKGKDAWEATKSGIADIAWCFHGYWSGMTPLADVVSLPALPFKTAEKGSEVLWKLYEKYPSIQKEFDDNKILLLFTSNPYILITTKKQVKVMEDIRGLKIRMTGGPPTEMMKSLGGTPMMIPMPDNYISLQKGVIDGMGAPWEAIHGFRLYEVVNYFTDTPFPAVYFSIAMNKRKWNSLGKEIQDAIMSVSGLAGSKFWGRNFFDTAKEGVMEKAKAAGKSVELYSLSDAERQRWLDTAGRPIWKQWVKKMEAKGYANAQEILDTTVSLSQ
ncbi:MAG: TRAP transporter substrate-binding protein [Desulfobacteraceae bacterium]|jgi:TRAP-type C4-dicarboxylate transport system substrate-binding protein